MGLGTRLVSCIDWPDKWAQFCSSDYHRYKGYGITVSCAGTLFLFFEDGLTWYHGGESWRWILLLGWSRLTSEVAGSLGSWSRLTFEAAGSLGDWSSVTSELDGGVITSAWARWMSGPTHIQWLRLGTCMYDILAVAGLGQFFHTPAIHGQGALLSPFAFLIVSLINGINVGSFSQCLLHSSEVPSQCCRAYDNFLCLFWRNVRSQLILIGQTSDLSSHL